jgi:hypothetical protein
MCYNIDKSCKIGGIRMQKRIPIGISDFRKLREGNYYFVDKTLLIKEVVEDGAEIILLPRPRRFGKTLNLSMLHHFFSISPVEYDDKDVAIKKKKEELLKEIKDENKVKAEIRKILINIRTEENPKELFKGLKIKEWNGFEKHCCKYPVIYLSLKEAEMSHWEGSFEKLKQIISGLYDNYKYLFYFLDEKEKEYFLRVSERKGSQSEYELSLRKLSEYLYKFWGEKTIILIDEYDLPIHKSYFSGFYTEMIDFMRSFLSAGLKDNVNVFKGVLTGILRVSRESIFSGLNNLGVYSLLSPEYSDKFGFTGEELKVLLKELKSEDLYAGIKNWYDGYKTMLKGVGLYNPWSVLNFLKSKIAVFRPYWVNTSSNNLIKEQVLKADAEIKAKVLDLIEGKSVESTLEENIVFEELEEIEKESIIWSFFFFSGYLTFEDYYQKGDRYYYRLLIPNKEIKLIFEDIIIGWFNKISRRRRDIEELIETLVEKDIASFERILQDFVMQALSYHDLAPDIEAVYHAFFVGLFFNLQEEYEIISNRESGLGRLDIALIPKDKKRSGIIMELKRVNKRRGETVELSIERAFNQIEKMQYAEELKRRKIDDILKLAVVFDGKRIWVKEKK